MGLNCVGGEMEISTDEIKIDQNLVDEILILHKKFKMIFRSKMFPGKCCSFT